MNSTRGTILTTLILGSFSLGTNACLEEAGTSGTQLLDTSDIELRSDPVIRTNKYFDSTYGESEEVCEEHASNWDENEAQADWLCTQHPSFAHGNFVRGYLVSTDPDCYYDCIPNASGDVCMWIHDWEFVCTTEPLVTGDPIIPKLILSNSPWGIFFSSGDYSSQYHRMNAVRGPGMWLSTMYTDEVFIGFQSSQPHHATSYELTYNNGDCCTQRAPQTFRLEGFSPGLGWVTIDSRSDQTGWFSGQTRTFDIPNPGTFGGYRLVVTEDNYNLANPITMVSIGRFQLFG